MSDIGHRFARLVFAAIESPATVDRSDLLLAASRLLDVGVPDDSPTGSIALTMAHRACDFAVLGTPDDYRQLKRAVECFHMAVRIKALEA
ncbi:MAG: hypothetical protein ACLP3C_22715 [Mycobacterium sp.]|uniref:hypothetical protein n=1 Tax=Mycobacterium sp. TaxID=1785 RepID=UPI003F9B80FB